MEVARVRDVKLPERSTPGSAGYDFFVPNTFPGSHWLATNQSIKIPSGLHVKIPKGYALVALNRSSKAFEGLQVGACLGDCDYQGEYSLHVTNIGDELVEIKPGMRLVQMILIECLIGDVVEKPLDKLFDKPTHRGSEGFGSTERREFAEQKSKNISLESITHPSQLIGLYVDNPTVDGFAAFQIHEAYDASGRSEEPMYKVAGGNAAQDGYWFLNSSYKLSRYVQ